MTLSALQESGVIVLWRRPVARISVEFRQAHSNKSKDDAYILDGSGAAGRIGLT